MIKNVMKIVICSLLYCSATTVFAQDVYRMNVSDDELYIEQSNKGLQNTNLQAYKLEGINYYKLRDFAAAIGSKVDFDIKSKTVNITTETNEKSLNRTIAETKLLEAEMVRSDRKLTVDGVITQCELYIMDGYHYISFADLARIYHLNYRDKDNLIIIYKDDSMPENPEKMFSYIRDKLEIDCAAGEIDALTQYLDENLEGFEKENCQVEMIHPYTEEGDYQIRYTLFHNGIPTPYQVLVFVDPQGEMKYVNKLDGYHQAVATMDHTKRTNLTEAELSQIALKSMEGYENFTVESQEVEMRYDFDMSPYVLVQITLRTENGALFAKNFEYYL